jgi:hypothetical protein
LREFAGRENNPWSHWSHRVSLNTKSAPAWANLHWHRYPLISQNRTLFRYYIPRNRDRGGIQLDPPNQGVAIRSEILNGQPAVLSYCKSTIFAIGLF